MPDSVYRNRAFKSLHTRIPSLTAPIKPASTCDQFVRDQSVDDIMVDIFCLPIYSTTIAFQPRTVSPECSFFSLFSLSRTSQQPWLISGSTKMRQLSRCRAAVQNTCLLLILLDMTFWCVIDENTRAENELKKRNRLTFDSLLRLLIL